ncbi:hypothetical protein DTW90_37040 [Neorhizobium sp. P12A]|nr:hypothetical protein DTW90_37040 [Neorhizobium sp. P12A]
MNIDVRTGVDLVGRTGRSLDDIVAQVAEINENVAAIVEAAREQATGLKEINTAVNSMDLATQQNAAMTEESTAASAELAAQAAEQRPALARFDTAAGALGSVSTVQRRQRRAARRPDTRPLRVTEARDRQPAGDAASKTSAWPPAHRSSTSRTRTARSSKENGLGSKCTPLSRRP